MANKQSSGKFLKKNVQKRLTPTKPASKKKPGTGSASTPAIVFTVLTLLVSLVASCYFLGKLGVSISLPSLSKGTIPENVTVAGVDVGGLTKKEAVQEVSSRVEASYGTKTMVITVLDKQLEITPDISGAKLDVDAAVRDAFSYGTEANPAKTVDLAPHIQLNDEAIRSCIAYFSVQFPSEGTKNSHEILTETVDGKEQAFLQVTVGTASYDFDADALYSIIVNAYANQNFAISYDCSSSTGETIDLEAIYEESCIEAKDATWDPETHQVVESQVGYEFDLEAAKLALAGANPGDVLKFPYVEILPEVETEALEGALFRDVLGTYTAKSSSSYNRDNNLKLACEAIDGIILYPGDTFSYNEALGERTPEKGYLPADSYMGSETIKTYGGGICQPSSSLYYCALLADLEIVQRSNHGFISSYMPYGMDATVDWAGPDFKFSNSTNYPIRIDAEATGGSVTVSLVGTDEKDYYIEMEYEILSVSSFKTVEEEIGPNEGHKDGEVKTTPYTGYTVQTYKCKYDKETKELISREKEAYSEYDKRDKVVYKIIETTEPTQPETTEPTQPETTEPTQPETTEPTQPETTEPTQPETTEPTQPETTEPETTEPAPTDPPIEGGGIGEATG